MKKKVLRKLSWFTFKIQCFLHPAYATIVEALGEESAVEERLEDT
jgi:hypothetical protein